jgi:thioredoxin
MTIKKYIMTMMVLFSSTVFLVSCQNKQNNAGGKLSAKEFNQYLTEHPNAQLIDVRTAEEFNEGHIKGAKNLDINQDGFEAKLNELNKEEPVLVYCLSGGRSGSAAGMLRSKNFKTVYEMPGILKWNAEGLPLETSGNQNASADQGMTSERFAELTKEKEYVLVDFFAVWCKPCKQIGPMVEKISKEKSDKLKLVKIDADLNPSLLQKMGIDGIPVLQLYHNGVKVWEHMGLIDETSFLKETKL